MKIIVNKEDAVITSEWAGGITKQYYIFPQSASLAARDFFVRLSMATAFTDEEYKR